VNTIELLGIMLLFFIDIRSQARRNGVRSGLGDGAGLLLADIQSSSYRGREGLRRTTNPGWWDDICQSQDRK